MELEQAIQDRRSIRKFLDTPVPDEIIEKLLEMARLAPSGGNGQDHVFGVVRDAAIKQELAKAAGNQGWIADAPVVIACCARLGQDLREIPKTDFGIRVNLLRWGEAFWSYLMDYPQWRDVSCLLANAAPMIPTEHIVLEAVANGLSSCYIGWLDVEKASRILNLPDDIRCMYLLPVGYAAEHPAEHRPDRHAGI